MKQSRIEQHVEETRRHADMVEQCVERLGSSTSAVKTGIGSLFGAIQSIPFITMKVFSTKTHGPNLVHRGNRPGLSRARLKAKPES